MLLTHLSKACNCLELKNEHSSRGEGRTLIRQQKEYFLHQTNEDDSGRVGRKSRKEQEVAE